MDPVTQKVLEVRNFILAGLTNGMPQDRIENAVRAKYGEPYVLDVQAIIDDQLIGNEWSQEVEEVIDEEVNDESDGSEDS